MAQYLYLLWLLLAVLALLLPLTAYRDETLPWWPMLPLSAALVFLSLYGHLMPAADRHGTTVVSLLALLLPLHLILTHVAPFSFH